jgi:hypothetical protein
MDKRKLKMSPTAAKPGKRPHEPSALTVEALQRLL